MVLVRPQCDGPLRFRVAFIFLASHIRRQLIVLQVFGLVFELQHLLIFVLTEAVWVVLDDGPILNYLSFNFLSPIIFIKARCDRLLGRARIFLLGLFDLVAVAVRLHFGEPKILL